MGINVAELLLLASKVSASTLKKLFCHVVEDLQKIEESGRLKQLCEDAALTGGETTS